MLIFFYFFLIVSFLFPQLYQAKIQALRFSDGQDIYLKGLDPNISRIPKHEVKLFKRINKVDTSEVVLINYSVPLYQLSTVRKEEKEEMEYFFQITIKDKHGSNVFQKSERKQIRVNAEQLKENYFYRSKINYQLRFQAGEYNVLVRTIDLHTKLSYESKHRFKIIDFRKRELFLSDILMTDQHGYLLPYYDKDAKNILLISPDTLYFQFDSYIRKTVMNYAYNIEVKKGKFGSESVAEFWKAFLE